MALKIKIPLSAAMLILACLSSFKLLVQGQNNPIGGSGIASLPGAQTAAGVISSSLDGASRYLAPDGPIQPAITAIGGLPLRGVEYANGGLTSISSSLNNGAQSMSRAAGNNGRIAMPGMEYLRSSVPSAVSSLGGTIQSGIRSKNNFIRSQAENGVQAGQRLRTSMQNGLQGALQAIN